MRLDAGHNTVLLAELDPVGDSITEEIFQCVPGAVAEHRLHQRRLARSQISGEFIDAFEPLQMQLMVGIGRGWWEVLHHRSELESVLRELLASRRAAGGSHLGRSRVPFRTHADFDRFEADFRDDIQCLFERERLHAVSAKAECHAIGDRSLLREQPLRREAPTSRSQKAGLNRGASRWE